jgi:hypothetical protein
MAPYAGAWRQQKSYLLFNLFYRKFGWITSALTQVIPGRAIGRLAARISYRVNDNDVTALKIFKFINFLFKTPERDKVTGLTVAFPFLGLVKQFSQYGWIIWIMRSKGNATTGVSSYSYSC